MKTNLFVPKARTPRKANQQPDSNSKPQAPKHKVQPPATPIRDSPTSSSASLSPSTVVSAGGEVTSLPEAAQQPILETIDPRGKASEKTSLPPKSVSSSSSNGVRSQQPQGGRLQQRSSRRGGRQQQEQVAPLVIVVDDRQRIMPDITTTENSHAIGNDQSPRNEHGDVLIHSHSLPEPETDPIVKGMSLSSPRDPPAPVPPPSARRQHHHRTYSDEIPRTISGPHTAQPRSYQQQRPKHVRTNSAGSHGYRYPPSSPVPPHHHYPQQHLQSVYVNQAPYSPMSQQQQQQQQQQQYAMMMMAMGQQQQFQQQQQQQVMAPVPMGRPRTYSADGAMHSPQGYPQGYPSARGTRSSGWEHPPLQSQRAQSERLVGHATATATTGTGSERPSTSRSSRRTTSRRREHRRAYSSGAAYPTPAGYGSFWSASLPPPPPPPEVGGRPASYSPSQTLNKNFDPRNEFLNLTSNLRSSNSPRRGDMSPVASAKTPLTNSLRHVPDMHLTWSPRTPLGPDPATSVGVGTGGEAVYLAQKRHKAESSRRKHMRQHSAQLFMEDLKGVPQAPACRDVIFLLLFVFHLLFIVFLGNLYVDESVRERPEAEEEELRLVTVYYQNLLYISCLSGAFAVLVSSLLLGVMTLFARYFVQVALVVIITLSFTWGTIGIGLSPKNVVPITGIIALALSVAYTFIVWDRIPFASANLVTALTAVRENPSIVFVALVFQALMLGWSIYFCVVVIGVYDSIHEAKLAVSHQWAAVIYTLLGISFYWTFQVVQNTVQAVTAGVVSSWWHTPNADGIVRQASFKTIFYSMGSICFGSLFVGPVRVIRQIAVIFRPTSDEASLLCLHECLHCIQTCITSIVDALARHFNPWAFTYIGLYSYSFTSAGAGAWDLFEKRGWTMIASDDLVPNVLLMTSLVLGGITGCFAFLLERLDGLHILSLDEPAMVAFWVGIVNGLVLTGVLLGLIGSSVNAVLVCFAVSPVDFDTNHPELSDEMRTAWREVWPGALDVVDLRMALSGANQHYISDLSPLIGPGPPPSLDPPLMPRPLGT